VLPELKKQYGELHKQAADARAEASKLSKPVELLQQRVNASAKQLKDDDVITGYLAGGKRDTDRRRVDEHNSLVDELKEAERVFGLAESRALSFGARAARVKQVIDALEAYQKPDVPRWIRSWLKS
jgi:hypothetical protein